MRAHITASNERLEETGFPLGVIVVDTLTAAYAGVDANSQADVTRAMKHLKRLAMDLKCLVLVIGHTGKDTTRGMAGSFAYKSESDSFIELQVETDELDDTVRRRSVFVEKVKDGASEFTLADYELEEVRIGTKPNGKPITTCVVRWRAPERKKAAAPAYSGAYQTILEALQNGGLTTWEVAEKLGVDRSNAGKKLRKLEQDGAIFARDDGPRKIWVAIAHDLPSENE
jgi:RecA-family ATPase